MAMVIGASVNFSVSAALPFNTQLEFDPGSSSSYGKVLSGSYFGMDTNGDGIVRSQERTPLSQHNGLIIGTIQAATGSHIGYPDGTESPGIDAPWSFFSHTGMHYTSSPSNVISNDGAGHVTLDFSGFGVTWNGIAMIDMGGLAWEGNNDGEAVLTCQVRCALGERYTLDYSATVPASDSGFGGVRYNFHLEGTVSQAGPPVPTQDLALTLNGGSNQECASTGGNTITANADITTSDVNDIVSVNWLLDNVSIGSGNSIETFASLGSHELRVEVTTVESGTLIRSTPVNISDNTSPNLDIVFIDQKTGDKITQVSSQFKNTVQITYEATDICDPEPISAGHATQSEFVGNNSTIEIDKGILKATAVNVSGNSRDSSNNRAYSNATLLVVD